ncbi:TadG family pilus assembly protein [Methylobacterium sp. A54F]
MTGWPATGRPVLRLRREQGGTVAVLVGLGATVLMGAAAVGIDLGQVVQARRRAQGAVDVAALVAAANPAQAEALARRSLADNGYAGATPITIAPGAYAGDAAVAPGSRFRPGAAPANAVRVNLRTSVPTHFARVVGLAPSVEVRVAGTAATAQFAAFTLGSGTAALDGGVANAVLGAMLGTRLSLSVLDYNALLSAQVDAFRFLDALGTSLGVQAASYSDVVRMDASVGQIVSSLRTALQGEANVAFAVSALASLGAALPSASASVPVSRVVDLGDAAALAPGRGSAGPRVGAMDLISGAAAVANGQRQVSVDLGASIPGLLATRLTLAVGERRQSSGWVQPGSANATLHTAQTRLLIEATLAAPLGLGGLSLPLYAEIAPAQASLRAVTCPWSNPAQRRVSLDAQPGLLNLAIADVPRSAIAVGAATPDLGRGAALLSLPLLTVRGQARASLTGAVPQTLTFSDDDISRRVVRTVSSTGLTQSLTGSLIQGLNLDINGLNLLPALRPALATTLSLAAPALDLVLDGTLRALGLRLGYADVTVDGTRCDQAVLVQ